MSGDSKTFAIIPAAGKGLRFGKLKQLEIVAGKPLLIHSLQAFEQSLLVSGIVVVVPETEISSIRDLLKKEKLTKILQVVPGGQERQDSVAKGFAALPACDFILVHDGARPLVSVSLIENVLKAAQEHGAAVPGIPVSDTLKKVRDGRIIETIDRSDLWAVQTPQAFATELFQRALKKAEQERFYGTDEAMLVERLGVEVRMVLGDPENIKVTRREDLSRVEHFLSQEKAGS